ncbi:FAD-dependent oxidoreductase [Erythrobacter sanguineus]|uniref:Pyridine nucleotide-disulfide oxidoreductase family protein n=1 Tax=Erythrobacter sanguineus TaxID=198312 RepID=A0A1M7RZ69_9SPHN|nr:FAD-dependent oxidoreductase [Erythrobacter sanguineus]SHN51460.1 pyridine nucleotide-disulfide oxidoreductase family protein [Erythrobacter sanguineus]
MIRGAHISPDDSPQPKLLLVGGGHAHVAVLADWIRNGPPPPGGAARLRTLLLTPHPTLRYSGMVPGWLAGQHARDQGLVDLAALAARAGAVWVQGRCVALDPQARVVHTETGETITFDLASFDTGGVGRGHAVLGDDPRLIDIRPIDAFVARIAARPAPRRVVVAGGGAGGVELAFGLRNLASAEARPEVVLATGAAGLLPGFSQAVRKRVARAQARQGIMVIAEDARLADGAIMAGNRSLEPADLIVAALGSAAPDWVRESGLAVDDAGFALVDRHQRSCSHPHIFVAGDVAARADLALAHSGVHAVFAGPVLAANLRKLLAGEPPRRSYQPRWNSLYLMNTGDGSAIASYGRLAAQGAFVLRLKHWIDKRWIAQYAALAGTA